jgi:fructose-1,6-bisphosphatase
MRNGEFSHEEVGTTNSSGDEQLHVDLSTEQIIFKKLRHSGLYSLCISHLYQEFVFWLPQKRRLKKWIVEQVKATLLPLIL